MSESYDPYAVLGVPRTASSAQIEAAWKKRIRLLHPDSNADADADEQASSTRSAQRVNRARQALRDPVHRAAIDLDLGGTPLTRPVPPTAARAEPTAPFGQAPPRTAHTHVDPASVIWQQEQELLRARARQERARVLHTIEHRLFDPRALMRSLRTGAAYLRSMPASGHARWSLTGLRLLFHWLCIDRRAQWLVALAWAGVLMGNTAIAPPAGGGAWLVSLGLVIQLGRGWTAGLLVQWIAARRRCHTPATDVLGFAMRAAEAIRRRI